MAVDVSADLQSDQLTEWFRSLGVHRQSNYPPFSLITPTFVSALGSCFRCTAARPTRLPINLKPRIPKGFRLKAQGCRACEATLGLRRRRSPTPTGLRQTFARRFIESLNVRRTAIAILNRPDLLPLPIRWGEGARVRGAVTSASPRFTEKRSQISNN
jgi:hypothetical protein